MTFAEMRLKKWLLTTIRQCVKSYRLLPVATSTTTNVYMKSAVLVYQSAFCTALLLGGCGREAMISGGEKQKIQNVATVTSEQLAFVQKEQQIAFGNVLFGDWPELVNAKLLQIPGMEGSEFTPDTYWYNAGSYKFLVYRQFFERELYEVQFKCGDSNEELQFVEDLITTKYGNKIDKDYRAQWYPTGGYLAEWQIGKKTIQLLKFEGPNVRGGLLKIFHKDYIEKKEQSDQRKKQLELEQRDQAIKDASKIF
jgi:hypothetical protein